jgi:predicted nucleic acid-binding protein
MIHLDTSFLIHMLRPGSRQDRRALAWLARSEPIGISAFAWTEFLCGPVSPEAAAHALELLGEPAPLDRVTAERAAELFNASGRRRGSLGDCLVAAAAMQVGAHLATENRADFTRFSAAGLLIAE